tara:strand:+ start:223 stop:636 length:414 start_codon:yes stop_codon:yes gene_type:complete
MNNDFYNSKYTISGDIDDIDIPFNFDIYSGSNSSIYMQIKEHEFNNDEFYNGHLIVRDKSKLKDIDLENLNKYKLTPNSIYFYKVEHSGFDWECKVDDSLILCSSWVIPFVLNEHKIDNSLYGEMATHRIEMKEFNQ